MSRIIILFGGLAALLVAAGATTLAFNVTTPEVTQRSAIPVAPIHPAILSLHLQKMRGEIARP
jgi:hypothetical protein